MSKARYNDEYLKYIKDKNLRELLKDPTKSIVCTRKRFVVEESSDEDNEEVVVDTVEDTFSYIEEIYHRLKEFSEENGLCLLNDCDITDFIEYINSIK